jgi:hypothetical protein
MPARAGARAADGGREYRLATMTRGRTTAKRSLLFAGALLVVGLGVSGALPGLADALAYLLPPLVLLVALLRRRYPGERALLGLIRARRAGRREPVTSPTARGPCRGMMPRGGRLIACSLAVRPPPLLLARS